MTSHLFLFFCLPPTSPMTGAEMRVLSKLRQSFTWMAWRVFQSLWRTCPVVYQVAGQRSRTIAWVCETWSWLTNEMYSVLGIPTQCAGSWAAAGINAPCDQAFSQHSGENCASYCVTTELPWASKLPCKVLPELCHRSLLKNSYVWVSQSIQSTSHWISRAPNKQGIPFLSTRLWGRW